MSKLLSVKMHKKYFLPSHFHAADIFVYDDNYANNKVFFSSSKERYKFMYKLTEMCLTCGKLCYIENIE